MRTMAGLATALVLTGAACGGSATKAGPDPSKRLVTLSTAEQQSLCDWLVPQEGGYGHTTQCEASGTPLETPSDQSACVADFSLQATRFPNCPATVGQWESCATWFLANWCAATPPTRPAECNDLQSKCY